jgi:hypothetical protein
MFGMSIFQQRLIFMGLLVILFFGYQMYLRQNPSFPCETLRNSPVHALDSEYVREVGRKSRFISWVQDWYGTQPQEEDPYLTWEKEGITYQAYFNGVDLESVTFNVSAFQAKVADITACFGAPSTASAIVVSTDRGLFNNIQLRYDDLRMSISATSPTTQREGTIVLPDANADVTTLLWFSIPAYEREKH